MLALIPALSLSLWSVAPAPHQDPLPPAPPVEEVVESPPPPPPAELPPAGYLTPERLSEELQALAAASPRLELSTLGTSPLGRPIHLATFRSSEGAGDKPDALIVANLEGDRLAASEVAIGLIRRLAQSDRAWSQTGNLHIVALANPDGAARAMQGLDPRRGQPVDEDRDGRMDEDQPEDIDGDGRILWVRQFSAAGEYFAAGPNGEVNEKVEAAKTKAGEFHLRREGRDVDQDRHESEDDFGGIAVDANFPHRWHEHQSVAGPFPLSEPESRALATFLLSRPQIAWVIVLDDEDNLASVPGGIDSFSINAKDPLKGDAPYLKRWSESLYPKDQKELKKPKGADHGRGNFADWAYYQLGAFVLESSLWSIPVESGEDKGSEEVQRVAWAQATYGGAGYAPWRPFTLPEVGELQVGGWAPLVQVNPPADQLPALVERYHGWLSGMADDFARLQWAEVELKPLDFQEVYQLRARLVNVGPLPSQSAMADVNRRLLPIRVQLELPAGVELLTGRMTQTVGTLAAGGGSEELEWIVRRPAGAAPLSLTAAGPTCGKASQTIE